MKKNQIYFKAVCVLIILAALFVFFLIFSAFGVLPIGLGTGSFISVGYYVESDYGDDAIYQPRTEGNYQIIFLIDDSEDQYLPDDLETGDRIQIRFGGLLDQDENGIWSLKLSERVMVIKRLKWWFQGVTEDEIALVNEQAALLHGGG